MTSSDPPPRRITLGGIAVDLASRGAVLDLVGDRLGSAGPEPALLIASANLHHVGTFRPGGPDGGFFERSPNDWLVLLDGAPLVHRAQRLTGTPWPLLAGSDLLPAILEIAAKVGAPVGFLGGDVTLGPMIAAVCTRRWPALELVGHWAPSSNDLDDDVRAGGLAAEIALAAPALLVVGLGKPHQERWLERFAPTSGIRVGLAFGASAEFLVGGQTRAPTWVRTARAEWLWRLTRDPKRLTRRYLIEGPGEWWWLRRDSSLEPPR